MPETISPVWGRPGVSLWPLRVGLSSSSQDRDSWIPQTLLLELLPRVSQPQRKGLSQVPLLHTGLGKAGAPGSV